MTKKINILTYVRALSPLSLGEQDNLKGLLNKLAEDSSETKQQNHISTSSNLRTYPERAYPNRIYPERIYPHRTYPGRIYPLPDPL